MDLSLFSYFYVLDMVKNFKTQLATNNYINIMDLSLFSYNYVIDMVKNFKTQLVTNKTNKQIIIVILILFLMWRILKNNVILLLAIAYLLYVNAEGEGFNFSKDGTSFVDVGENKYDLAGRRVWFTPPDSNVSPREHKHQINYFKVPEHGYQRCNSCSI
jgi:hypothetical protein